MQPAPPVTIGDDGSLFDDGRQRGCSSVVDACAREPGQGTRPSTSTHARTGWARPELDTSGSRGQDVAEPSRRLVAGGHRTCGSRAADRRRRGRGARREPALAGAGRARALPSPRAASSSTPAAPGEPAMSAQGPVGAAARARTGRGGAAGPDPCAVPARPAGAGATGRRPSSSWAAPRGWAGGEFDSHGDVVYWPLARLSAEYLACDGRRLPAARAGCRSSATTPPRRRRRRRDRPVLDHVRLGHST